jgi:hypothetical protein
MVRREGLTISIKRIGISIGDGLGRRQGGSSRVAIAVVGGARAVNARSMGEFVEGRGGLILAVAGPG